MTISNISFAQYLSGQLRKAVASGSLTDYNAANRNSQFGNWIYPDAPMIVKLMKNTDNFPRISVESLSNPSSEEMGMEDPNLLETNSLKINVWTVRDLICTVKSTTAETIAYDELVTKYALINLPVSAISAVDDGVTTFIKGTDYNLIDNDGDGFYDTIEWLGADEPTDGADFYVDYKRSAAGAELVRLIAQDVNAYLRTWRDWSERIVWDYRKLSSVPIPFDETYGIYRFELTVQFSGINIGEDV